VSLWSIAADGDGYHPNCAIHRPTTHDPRLKTALHPVAPRFFAE
jgi:hypothetical protein